MGPSIRREGKYKLDKMRVYLIVPPVLFARQVPISIAYLAAYLKDRGHEVQARDLNIEIQVSNDSDDRFWSDYSHCADFFISRRNLFEESIEKILNFSPKVVGFSVWSSTVYFALKMAEMIKERNKNILIVFGGFWCSGVREELMLNNAVDIVVYGEGEATLADIVENCDNNKQIPGCLIKYNGEIKDGGNRKEIDNLDSLPFPDLSFFPLDKYLFKNHAPISFSRGCDWRCSFCITNFQWKEIRRRSADNIKDEIACRLEQFSDLKGFEVCDPSINTDMNLLNNLCDLIIKNNIKVSFNGYAQIKRGMTPDFLRKLKEAGFPALGFGMESGSNRVLNIMRRPYTTELAERVIKDAYNSGIKVILGFIVGMPGEQEEDFQGTLNFIKRVKNYVQHVSNANEFTIMRGSYVACYPERFSIIYNGANTWETDETSFQTRKRRVEIFNDFVESLGLLTFPAKDRERYSTNLSSVPAV